MSNPNELRRNPLTRNWIVFAESGLSIDELLEKTRAAAANTPPPAEDPCPFCPGNESMTPPEIMVWHNGAIRYRRDHGPAGSNWQLRVFPSQYPLFRLEGELGRRAERNYDVLNAIGANEIIVDSHRHPQSWMDVSHDDLAHAIRVYRERMRDLMRNPNLGHQALYKHVGLRRASQIVHPYAQLIAAPVVPERVREELDSFREHFSQKERCLLCDIVHEVDRTSNDCKVAETPGYSAFVPYFAPHPFEVWVVPRRHQAFFPEMPEEEIAPAAELVLMVLRKLEKLLGGTALTLTLHTAPNPNYAVQHGYWKTLGEDYHWRLAIIPRLPMVADLYRGFVLGTHFHVNPFFPEIAGALLRNAAG